MFGVTSNPHVKVAGHPSLIMLIHSSIYGQFWVGVASIYIISIGGILRPKSLETSLAYLLTGYLRRCMNFGSRWKMKCLVILEASWMLQFTENLDIAEALIRFICPCKWLVTASKDSIWTAEICHAKFRGECFCFSWRRHQPLDLG